MQRLSLRSHINIIRIVLPARKGNINITSRLHLRITFRFIQQYHLIFFCFNDSGYKGNSWNKLHYTYSELGQSLRKLVHQRQRNAPDQKQHLTQHDRGVACVTQQQNPKRQRNTIGKTVYIYIQLTKHIKRKAKRTHVHRSSILTSNVTPRVSS